MRSRVRDNITATTPVAMYAVAQHMLDYDLPAPLSIEAPHRCDTVPAVLIGLYSHQVNAWLDTIVVDDETITAVPAGLGVEGYERVAYDARLPDTGVRISIRCTRRVVPLRLVGATS